MGNFLAMIQLIPVIIELVKSVEQVSGGKVKIGAEKSALILEAVKVCFDAVGDIPKKLVWGTVAPIVLNVASVFVGFANKVGLFSSSSNPPAEANGQ
jgi:hypothetical protein